MNLKAGCYLIAFQPNAQRAPASPGLTANAPAVYLGTLRVVENQSESAAKEAASPPAAARPAPRRTPAKSTWRISGDLYHASANVRREVPFIADGRIIFPPKESEIPVLPLGDYAYYLDVTSVRDVDQGRPVLELRAHRFEPASRSLTPGAPCQLLLEEGDARGELVGRLMSGEQERGRFWLRWINTNLRRAKVRVFCVQPHETADIRSPRRAGGKQLPNPFSRIGWQLSVDEIEQKNADFGKIGDEPWGAYDLGVAAAKLRAKSDSELDWIYDLLCVSRFENNEYLGIMFDAEATDLNERPRESAAVAALQPICIEGKNVAAQDAFDGKLYLRTACHELGHAMNLPHNLTGRTLMNITEYLLSAAKPVKGATEPVPGFADEFKPDWEFDVWDSEWLQHAPDIAIRPGGISRHAIRWGRGSSNQVLSVSVLDLASVSLEVQPVLASFPWGAPVRLDYSMSNQGSPVLVPKDLSLAGGFLSGRVLGPDRRTRYFRSAFRCCDSVIDGNEWLQPIETTPRKEGMTLLRGIDGPLFPVPGVYEVELELKWDHEGRTRRVTGQTTVTVAPPDPVKDPTQPLAAQIALGRASLMPPLVQGYLDEESATALGYILQSPTLAPHYYATAVKCRLLGARQEQVLARLPALAQRHLPPERLLRTLRLSSVAPLKNPSIPIVLNARERRQLSEAMDRNSGVRFVGRDKITVDKPVIAWLNELKSIVVPSGRTASDADSAAPPSPSPSPSPSPAPAPSPSPKAAFSREVKPPKLDGNSRIATTRAPKASGSTRRRRKKKKPDAASKRPNKPKSKP